MKVQVLFLLVVTVSYVRAEPPAELPDEPLEGQRLDPELLSKVRELLISDISGSGNSPVSRGTPSSYAPPSNSYGAPNGGSQSFASPPTSGKFGGSGSSQSQRGSGGDITISDPELAPLISTFELSPTVQQRRNAPSRESNTGFGNSNFGKQTSGGY